MSKQEIQLERGKSFYAIVTGVSSPSERPGFPVRVVLVREVDEGGKQSELESIFPAGDGQAFTPGESILITPMVERAPSGGSITRYILTPQNSH